MNKIVHSTLKRLFSFLVILAISFAFHIDAKAAPVKTFNDSLAILNKGLFDGGINKLITCYPNPATSYINFKFDNAVPASSKLVIYSFTGRKMDEFSVKDNILKISLENYYRGLYVYQLLDANGNIVESGRFQVKN